MAATEGAFDVEGVVATGALGFDAGATVDAEEAAGVARGADVTVGVDGRSGADVAGFDTDFVRVVAPVVAGGVGFDAATAEPVAGVVAGAVAGVGFTFGVVVTGDDDVDAGAITAADGVAAAGGADDVGGAGTFGSADAAGEYVGIDDGVVADVAPAFGVVFPAAGEIAVVAGTDDGVVDALGLVVATGGCDGVGVAATVDAPADLVTAGALPNAAGGAATFGAPTVRAPAVTGGGALEDGGGDALGLVVAAAG